MVGSWRDSPALEQFDRMLRPHASSVAAARDLVRDLLTAAERDDLLDDAVLLVSEIVTNALIHAGSPIRVRGRAGADGVRVEVTDASPHHPALRDYADTAGTGRGLALMVELVDSWGVAPAEVGKTVWFELGSERRRRPAVRATALGLRSDGLRSDGLRSDGPDGAPHAGHPSRTGRQQRSSDATVRVRLLRMPMLLHAAWREHAETLLREYLLAFLDLDPEGGGASSAVLGNPIQVHAEATDAIALLEEQVPVARFDMDPTKLMAGATEPGVSAALVWLEVPETSVPHFATLERALDHALDLVDSRAILAPRTQPEIQAFRRWVCRQVADQAIGRPAVPWSFDQDTGPPAARPNSGAALQEITDSGESLIAADDANQIVAVSAPAVELLGYDSAHELVGRRLMAIIPPRFHQAHIAGFTLHMLVGRSPLLGREVEVPALRRDGSEVLTRLLISSRRAPEGTTLFVARLRDSG